MIIGISDNMGAEHKFDQYVDWLRRGCHSLEWIKLSYKLDNIAQLDRCAGLLMTGGGDVDPSLYGGNVRHPAIERVDRKRDEFERRLIDAALDSELPFLGICRGLQIANVHCGGTLIEDLAGTGHSIHETADHDEQRHDISVEQESFLGRVSGVHRGNVNSYHHQAAAEIGKGLKAVACSDDGVTEALELQDSNAESFFLMVQWHPERMKDLHNPLTYNILQRFLAAAEKKSTLYHEKEN